MANSRLDALDGQSPATEGKDPFEDVPASFICAIAEEVAWRERNGLPIYVDRGNGVEDLNALRPEEA